MARALLLAGVAVLAGCGSPGMPGRGIPHPDAVGPAGGSGMAPSTFTCLKLGCSERCGRGGARCGFTITSTGVRPAGPAKTAEK